VCTEGKTATLEIRSQTGASVAMAFIYPPNGSTFALEPQLATQAAPPGEQKLEETLTELYNRLRKEAGY